MANFGLHISIDPRIIRTWEQRFEREIPDTFARANKFVLDEVAKTAVNAFRRDAHKVIDRPKAWTLRGIRYKRATYSSGDWSNSFSEIYMLPDQSAVLKYLMGERTRRPGDVGPSTDYIAVPRWKSLGEIGIRPDKYGNMPSSTMGRLRREAGVVSGREHANTPSRKRATTQRKRTRKKANYGGVFFGEPVINGNKGLPGFWMRPKRVKRAGRWVNESAPRLLIYAARETTHQPILREFWEKNAARAGDDYSTLMSLELQSKLKWLRDRGR
ncbi:hypothetical protein [Pelagibacterium sp.]|uniref:hypothetical protein n=1 Tax=Pelagibacterium sp. TaxID=1967288 RepID=UPI003A8D9B16